MKSAGQARWRTGLKNQGIRLERQGIQRRDDRHAVDGNETQRKRRGQKPVLRIAPARLGGMPAISGKNSPCSVLLGQYRRLHRLPVCRDTGHRYRYCCGRQERHGAGQHEKKHEGSLQRAESDVLESPIRKPDFFQIAGNASSSLLDRRVTPSRMLGFILAGICPKVSPGTAESDRQAHRLDLLRHPGVIDSIVKLPRRGEKCEKLPTI